jgi:hypothetical protein
MSTYGDRNTGDTRPTEYGRRPDNPGRMPNGRLCTMTVEEEARAMRREGLNEGQTPRTGPFSA